jgi:hypothetical protein
MFYYLALVVALVAAVVVVVLNAREFDRRSTERYRRGMCGAASCRQCEGTGRYSPRMSVATVGVMATTSSGLDASRICPECQGTGYLPLEAAERVALSAREGNGLAVASLVLMILGLFTVIAGPIAAIPAYVARKRSWEDGRRGGGMAAAALIGGPLFALFGLPLVVPIELGLYQQWRT